MVKKRQSDNQQRNKIDRHIECLTCNDNDKDQSTLMHSLQILRDEVLDWSSDMNSNLDE